MCLMLPIWLSPPRFAMNRQCRPLSQPSCGVEQETGNEDRRGDEDHAPERRRESGSVHLRSSRAVELRGDLFGAAHLEPGGNLLQPLALAPSGRRKTREKRDFLPPRVGKVVLSMIWHLSATPL